MSEIVDSFQIGSKCIISQDADFRGNITIGSGCVIHPRCTLLAMSGPIRIGDNCIIEENAVIVNRTKEPMIIGNNNHFQVACRIESPSIGDHNIFGVRSRVSLGVSITSHCQIGAACLVLASPFPASLPPPQASNFATPASISSTQSPASEDVPMSEVTVTGEREDEEEEKPVPLRTEVLPPYTSVYGAESRRRLWSGEGEEQGVKYFARLIQYQQEVMPRFHKLKMF